jgi:thiol-disulfide isomerase/thioredoxin
VSSPTPLFTGKSLPRLQVFDTFIVGVNMRKSLMFTLSALTLLTFAASATTITTDELVRIGLQPLKEGTEIVDFELQDLSGVSRRLSDFRGKVVFLNFWATWCGPCRFEMPSMEKLYKRLKDEGLEIVAVNLQEDRSSVEQFVDEYGLSFPVLLDTTGRIGATYGARSIPTTYIVDREGLVIAGTIGTREWDTEDYVRFFEKLLAN